VQSTLVCTLGGQPQVVTFTLDRLLAQGERIGQVIVVWLAGEARYRRAFDRLKAEFVGDQYAGQHIHFHHRPVQWHGKLLARVVHATEIDAAWETFSTLLGELKAQKQHIHLSLAGGRRMLALVGLSAAMQHFGPSDCAWHLYTPSEITEKARDGALMHVSDERVQLLRVPVAPLGALFPGLRPALGMTPSQQQGALTTLLPSEEWQRCEQVWNQLSRRQRETLVALVQHASRKQAAQALHIAVSTLDTHKEEIFAACREAWPEAEVNLAFLRRMFRAYLATRRVD